MTAAAEQIYIHGIYIKRNLSIRLNCIRVKQNSMFMCYGSNSADWLYGSYSALSAAITDINIVSGLMAAFSLSGFTSPFSSTSRYVTSGPSFSRYSACVKNGHGVFYTGCDYMLSPYPGRLQQRT